MTKEFRSPNVLRLWPSDTKEFQLGLAKLRCIVDEYQVVNLNGDAPGWHASSEGAGERNDPSINPEAGVLEGCKDTKGKGVEASPAS